MSINRSTLQNLMFIGMVAFTLAACGSIDVDLEVTPTTTPDSSINSQLPEGVVGALQIAIAQLQTEFPTAAPASNADWQAQDITPPGLVGSGGYRFTIENWQIDITYPIVAPQSMLYSITADEPTTGLHWEGAVDSQGLVQSTTMAVAWPGRVVSGDHAGTFLLEISGDVGIVELTSSDPSIAERLQTIRDDTGPQGFVHVWGSVDCSNSADQPCSIEVTQLRSGTEITEPESIGPWEGTLTARTGPPSSGGDDWFTLHGDWPIQYGIWAIDEPLRRELEALRDTGQVVRIWGELTAGLPDWNGTQINVTQFELIN